MRFKGGEVVYLVLGDSFLMKNFSSLVGNWTQETAVNGLPFVSLIFIGLVAALIVLIAFFYLAIKLFNYEDNQYETVLLCDIFRQDVAPVFLLSESNTEHEVEGFSSDEKATLEGVIKPAPEPEETFESLVLVAQKPTKSSKSENNPRKKSYNKKRKQAQKKRQKRKNTKKRKK